MSSPTITMMPTLCVPEKLNKQELIDSYEAGDQAAILLQVKNLSEQRAKQKAKVH